MSRTHCCGQYTASVCSDCPNRSLPPENRIRYVEGPASTIEADRAVLAENFALRGRITELEDQVRRLNMALAGRRNAAKKSAKGVK